MKTSERERRQSRVWRQRHRRRAGDSPLAFAFNDAAAGEELAGRDFGESPEYAVADGSAQPLPDAGPTGRPGGQSYVTAEDEALDLVRACDGVIFVDLDETLYLRNSSEQYIACAKPILLAAFLLKILDVVRPWAFFGGSACRDNWRIAIVTCFFPWTPFIWRRFCRDEAASFVNRPLREALDGKDQAIIVTQGFRFIVTPMLEAAGLGDFKAIACRLLVGRDRRLGKIRLLQTHLPELRVAEALVVTDSLIDADLLKKARTGLLVRWSDARCDPPIADRIYFPGDYSFKIKHPNQRAMRRLFREDFLPWMLVGASFSSTPLQVIGIGLLFFSMWSVYEWGYYDNDQCALTLESDGVLTKQARAFRDHGLPLKAFSAATLLGIAGISLLHPDMPIMYLAAWFLVLASLAGVYRVYNRIDKNARPWLYLVLQLFRAGSILAVAAGGLVAWAFVLSQALARWMDYVLYRFVRARFGITKWPDRPQATTRLAILAVLLLPIMALGRWDDFVTPATLILALAIYNVLKFDLRKYRHFKASRPADTARSQAI